MTEDVKRSTEKCYQEEDHSGRFYFAGEQHKLQEPLLSQDPFKAQLLLLMPLTLCSFPKRELPHVRIREDLDLPLLARIMKAVNSGFSSW